MDSLPQINKIIPPLLPSVIKRDRLFESLDDYYNHSLTLVTGVAGAGKTTLIAHYLQQRGISHIWYRLDNGDTHISSFFYYLIQALENTRYWTRDPIPLLREGYSRRYIQEYSRRFFINLKKRLKKPYIIVLDNYNTLPANSLLHDIIKEWILVVSQSVNMFIISRETLPEVFSDISKNVSINTINNHDLAFTQLETELLIQKHVGKNISNNLVRQIHDTVSGWAAGLILTSKAFKNSAILPYSISNINFENFSKFFDSELFSSIDPTIQQFLLKTALLPRITPHIAETITNNPNASKILEHLLQNHLFIECYGNPHTIIYEYHFLFHEYLLSKARAQLKEHEIKKIMSCAASKLESQDLIEDAFELYLQLNNHEKMIDIILRHANSLVDQGRKKILNKWLQKLPDERFEENPWLNYWRGVSYKLYSPIDSKKYFNLAFVRFKIETDRAGKLLSWAGAVDNICYSWHNFRELDKYIKWLDANIDTHYNYPTPEIEEELALSTLYVLMLARPNHPDVDYWMQKTLSISKHSSDPELKSAANTLATSMYFFITPSNNKPPYVAIKELNDQLVFIQKNTDSDLVRLKSAYNDSRSFYWDNITAEETVEIAYKAINLANKIDLHIYDELILGVGIIAALVLKKYDCANDLLNRFENRLDPGNRYHMVAIYHLVKSVYHQSVGETIIALECANIASKIANETGLVYHVIICRMNLAQCLCLSDEQDEAMDHMRVTICMAEESKTPILKYMGRMFEAYIELKCHQKNNAIKSLHKALRIGKKYQLTRFLWWWHEQIMLELLTVALDNNLETDFVHQIIRSYEMEAKFPENVYHTWYWPVKIETMGKFQIKVANKIIPLPRKGNKTMKILNLLIAHKHHQLPVDTLIDVLWPDKDGDLAYITFSTTLNRLRKLLGSKKTILISDSKISINSQMCRTDVRIFERMIARAFDHQEPDQIMWMKKAFRLYKGKFLDKVSDQNWITTKREELREKYIAVTIYLGEYYEKENRIKKAIQYYEQGLKVEPAEEILYQHLMAGYIKLNRMQDVKNVYRQCSKYLKKKYKVAPSATTQEIFQSTLS